MSWNIYSQGRDTPRHRTFISYYHADDQYYKDHLVRTTDLHDIFVDYSVHQDEIDDYGLADEDIRKIIRDDYIKDSTVTILLCGKNTKHRKFIDWELHATMYNSDKNPKGGVLVINLPDSENKRVLSDLDAAAFKRYNPFYYQSCTHHSEIYSNNWYHKYLPDMPQRIVNSMCNDSPISVINWSDICYNPTLLKELIDNAFNLRWRMNYDTHTSLRRKNRHGHW